MPVVIDRCLQAMVKNALEPAWEAKFRAAATGFAQAEVPMMLSVKSIFWLVPTKRRNGFWMLTSKAHSIHLARVSLSSHWSSPWKGTDQAVAQSRYIEQKEFHATEQGTPQGGVISPLLLNIALHGMEQAIGVTYNSHGQLSGKRAVVRYADDFVCFCETKEDAEQVQETLTAWLKERGLTLSAEKTRIVHLTEGFNFLGFNIRHYRTPQTTKTGWKLLIKPSKRIGTRPAEEAQRALEKGSRNQCPERPQGAKPHHPWMGNLLSHCSGKGIVWEVG